MIDLAKAREICAKATPEPWWNNCFVALGDRDLQEAEDNADFIAFARTALPEALDEIESLRTIVALALIHIKDLGGEARLGAVEAFSVGTNSGASLRQLADEVDRLSAQRDKLADVLRGWVNAFDDCGGDNGPSLMEHDWAKTARAALKELGG